MKKLLTIIVLLIVSKVTYGQKKYIIAEISHRTAASDNTLSQEPYRPVSKKTIATLYRNALTISGDTDMYLVFTRKIDDHGNINYYAVDRGERECQVIIKDYGSYYRIGVLLVK